MTFYAHSREACAPRYWERLEPHLVRVAALARRFARAFGAGEWGRAAGLLHDLGKYSREFQRRLHDPRLRAEHSIQGARAADRLYPAWGVLLAYAIAGHHAGLPDGEGPGDDVLARRMKAGGTPPSPVWEERVRCPAPEALLEEIRTVLAPGGGKFATGFFVRMLFSCLVDADFLATEWFLDRERKNVRRARLPGAAELAPVLRRYMDDLPAASETRPAIQKQRAEILAACRARAAAPRGIFSLAVPTGAGKTLASLSFALEHAAARGLDRVVYAVPYTTIIEQTADVFRAALAEAGDQLVLEHHSAAEPPPPDEQHLIGPRRLQFATENWDAPLVVTTTVQLFESLYAARPSRCRKLHNLARSVIVLDEVQALPLPRLYPCLAALNELAAHYGSSILLCSATVPAFDDNPRIKVSLAKALPLVLPTPALHDAFRRVVSERLPGKIEDDALASHLAGAGRVLCIVDTRRHAAELFGLLPEEGRFHLSAAMCPAHRRAVLAEVKARLRSGAPCRLVSSAVIQAGVDVSFPEVWRALAGIDSLAQAAGRCNRHGEKPDGPGQFVVFESARSDALPNVLVDLHRRRAIACTVLDDGSDPLAPETVARFFDQLLKSEELDKNGCWDRLCGADPRSIPFRSVARDFRMIDDAQEPVYVPWNEEALTLLHQLEDIARARSEERRIPRDLLRRLQAYAVGVHGREHLVSDLVPLDPGPDRRFWRVADGSNLYDAETGLRPERRGLRNPEWNVL